MIKNFSRKNFSVDGSLNKTLEMSQTFIYPEVSPVIKVLLSFVIATAVKESSFGWPQWYVNVGALASVMSQNLNN
jgi:hypothetical protein